MAMAPIPQIVAVMARRRWTLGWLIGIAAVMLAVSGSIAVICAHGHRWFPEFVLAWSPSPRLALLAGSTVCDRLQPDVGTVIASTRRFTARQLASVIGRSPADTRRALFFLVPRGCSLSGSPHDQDAVAVVDTLVRHEDWRVRSQLIEFSPPCASSFGRASRLLVDQHPYVVRETHWALLRWDDTAAMAAAIAPETIRAGLTFRRTVTLDGLPRRLHPGCETDEAMSAAMRGDAAWPPMRASTTDEADAVDTEIRCLALSVLAHLHPQLGIAEILQRWPAASDAERSDLNQALAELPTEALHEAWRASYRVGDGASLRSTLVWMSTDPTSITRQLGPHRPHVATCLRVLTLAMGDPPMADEEWSTFRAQRYPRFGSWSGPDLVAALRHADREGWGRDLLVLLHPRLEDIASVLNAERNNAEDARLMALVQEAMMSAAADLPAD